VKFRTRLTLAMLAVVLVATAVGLLASTSQVRASYREALDDLFQAGARSVIAVREAEMGAVKARCRRLASLPRLVAAFEGENLEDLYLTADDELREFGRRASEFAVGGRANSGFLFLNANNQPIGDGSGRPDFDVRVAQRWAREPAEVRAATEQRVAFLEDRGVPTEVLFTPVIDPATGDRLLTLAIAFPYRVASAVPTAGGGELRNGLLLAGTLFGDQLPADAATVLSDGLGTARNASEVEFRNAGEPWIAYCKPLDPMDPSAQLVVAASLEPMRAALWRLMLSAFASGSLGVILGVMVAVTLSRGIARPVSRLAEAARRVGAGDLAVRVPVDRRDEIGQLAARFNDMTHGLALRDKYRGLLDLVADPGIAEEMIGGTVDLGGVTTPAAVIFCDIRGFTPLTNRLSAHEVVDLLNEHMTALTEVVYRHGGVVDKFVGDLIMAVFGAPRPGTDDAVRAARCAVDMVITRARINRGAKNPIEIGVGLAFGDMVAGCMGSRQRLNYTVLGDRVNLAARLCSAAPAMCVYADGAVRERLGPGWGVTPLEPLKVKGFSEPVQAYRLDSMEDSRS
jgi:class 3 adenylate cyclase